MRRIAGTMLGAVVALTLGACSSGGGGNNATCEPTGPKLSIVAQGFKFDTDCLAAKAGAPFSIELDNEDAGTPHNVSIQTEQGDKLFTGEVFSGVKTESYDVQPLEAGTYKFQCDVHPTMEGAFIVK
jgi:plastocyanin